MNHATLSLSVRTVHTPLLAAATALVLLIAGPARPSAQSYQINVLANFNGTNSAFPEAGLITSGNGTFYGTTEGSGTGGDFGSIFKWSASGGLQTLASFNGTNGKYPQGPLVTDGDGNFYGTTQMGGSSNEGTIFKWTASGGIQPLGSFSGANGEYPMGSLTMDANGNIYGTTQQGGASSTAPDTGDGTIFKWSASAGLQTLASFNGSNGNLPDGGLIADGHGNLYGTAVGGTSLIGNIFIWSASGGIQTVASFNGTNGLSPSADLVMDTGGNLYGTTGGGIFEGNPAAGTIFKWSASGGIQTLASFTGTNSKDPNGLITDGNGNFFGATDDGPVGGTINDGTIFKWSASGGLETLAWFDGTNGQTPMPGLAMDANGNLYGTTSIGGDLSLNDGYGDGVLFELARVVPAPNPVALFLPGAALILSMSRHRRRAPSRNTRPRRHNA
jgi:uncharacterized repeat protein (TIGR03803 family)